MAEELHRDGLPASDTVVPGALSALLADLVRAPEPVDAREPAAGALVGRFELVSPIGAGGFGVVWQARDRELHREVALKLVRPGPSPGGRSAALLHEAEAAARLSHDNVVPLFDVGRSEWGPYLVQELLRGETLATRLGRGRLPLCEALRILVGVARGVAHAHASGVVHRDLKPGNVFLCEDGRVKVLDFGLAHAFGRQRPGGGTPAYMAPEQLEEAPEDERTDVYALGVMLFELLSGKRPFEGKAEASARKAPALEVLGQPELGALVARLLAPDPRARPRDAREVQGALEERLAALERSGEGEGPPEVRRRRAGLRRVGLAGAGAVAGAAVAALWIWFHTRPPSVRPDGRLLVAVADVVNETGEAGLDVLSGLLVTSLEQSRRLAVLSQARVVDLALQAGRPGVTRADEAVAREVGRREGATALLLPAVRKLGATYAVELRAIDPVKDHHLFTVSDRAGSREGLLDALDRLSERVRLELREDASEVGKDHLRLAEATTRSLEAYQRYTSAIQLLNRDGNREGAARELEAAVRIDPAFAMAHAMLARIYSFTYGLTETYRRHMQAAEEVADRLPAKERAVLHFYQLCVRFGTAAWDDDAVMRAGRELDQRYPTDPYVLEWVFRGWDAAAKPKLAETALRRLLELEPGSVLAVGQLLSHLFDRPEEALAMTRRAVEIRRNPPNLNSLAEALLLTGDLAGSEAQALEALRLNAGKAEGALLESCVLLEQRGWREPCRQAWEMRAREAETEMARDRAEQEVVKSVAMEGRRREALRRSRILPEERRGSPNVLAEIYEIGVPLEAAVDAWAEARRIPYRIAQRDFLASYGRMDEAASIDARMEPGERSQEEVELRYRCHVLTHAGRHAEAAECYRVNMEQNRDLPGPVPGFYFAWQVASELLAAGRPEEALAVKPIGDGRRPNRPIDHASFYPRLALVRARALEQLGQPADGAKELDGVLELWKNADEDLPLLVEAKALRSRLLAAR